MSCKQLYYPDTGVLVTRFMSPEGVGEVVDWMPANTSRVPTDRHSLMRVIRVVRGTVRFLLECRPRFDYGRAEHELDLSSQDAVFRGPGIAGHLQATFPLTRDGQDVRGAITLGVGESAVAVFTTCAPDGEAPLPSPSTGSRRACGTRWTSGRSGSTPPTTADAGRRW